MNNAVLWKRLLCLLIVMCCLGIQNSSISAAQETPAISKSLLVEKKQPPKVGDENLPKIFLEIIEHDAGEVYEGTIATHSFIVKNKGKGDLLIKKVRPG